jgi:hypothetical protein
MEWSTVYNILIVRYLLMLKVELASTSQNESISLPVVFHRISGRV